MYKKSIKNGSIKKKDRSYFFSTMNSNVNVNLLKVKELMNVFLLNGEP